MTKEKCCLKEWEREAICQVCKAKAADIGREYLSQKYRHWRYGSKNLFYKGGDKNKYLKR